MQALLRHIARRTLLSLTYPSHLSKNLNNMSDAATPQNTLRDPVTGELVSKKCVSSYPPASRETSLFIYL